MPNTIYDINGEKIVLFPNANLKWACIGDSISNRNWYQPMVCDALGLSCTNYAQGGTCIAKKNSSDRTNFVSRVNTMHTCFDIVTVWGGVNDFGYNFGSNGGITLGTISDSTETTFYGAMNLLCEALTEKFKSAKIGFMTTTPIASLEAMEEYDLQFGGGDQANSKGAYLRQYCDAIKQVCERFSIPVLDLYTTSGFNDNNITIMTSDGAGDTPDGLHPSMNGFNKILNQLVDFIGNL